jgi:hypothetical protein
MQTKPRLKLVPKDARADQQEADYRATAVEDEIARPQPTKRPITGYSWDKFSREWAVRLKRARADGSMWALSHTLLAMTRDRDCVVVTTAVMTTAGLSRRHKLEILGRLERLGLIAVEWRGRKAPMVTPLYPPTIARR